MSATRSESVGLKPVAHRALGRQFIVNSIATAIFYAISLLIGLWYAPFTLHHLGISMQAVVPLAAGFITYMQFVTNGIGGSVGRFVLADIARGDAEAANATFNTFLVASERVALILIAAISVIVWFVVPHLDYPPGHLNSTRFVFAGILCSVIIQLWCLCFDCAIWISGRIDVRSAILTAELLIRVGTVVALFTVMQPSLWHIGAACLAAPMGSLILYYIAWRKLAPELSIDRTKFDARKFREIRGMGGWLLVFQLGAAMQFNADLILLNLLLGRELQGSYAMLLVWSNMLRGLFGSMGQLVSPSVAAYQASGENEKLAHFAINSVRIQGMLISIPVGVLCGLAGPVLRCWLRPEYGYLADLLAPMAWLILVPLVLEGSFNPVFILIQAPEAIPFPAKASVALGLLNVVLGFSLVKFTGMGIYGMALAVATTLILRYAVVLPIYAAKVMHQPWYVLIQQQAQIVIQLAITGGLAWYASQYVHGRSLPQLVLAASAAGAIATVIAALQLSQPERERLLALVRRR